MKRLFPLISACLVTATAALAITVTDVAEDWGDAPDTAAGTAAGNYNTLASDGGPAGAGLTSC